jgi:general secretion pathway protein G
MNKKLSRKRRFITLIEMMIVMFLIALITGVVAYNYQGGLEKGKKFKTEQGMEKIKMILTLRVAEEPESLKNMESDWKTYIEESPLVQNPASLVLDGWGDEYEVKVEDVKGEKVIKVSSKHLSGN